jgi:GAF domain-containing protein
MSGTRPETPGDFADLARVMAEREQVLPTLEAVEASALKAIPCQWVSVAVMQRITPRPARLAVSTDPALASTIASIANAAGASPGITAFEEGAVVVCNDLATESGYGTYARNMVARTPVRAVLAIPLVLRSETVGVLTCYAAQPGAFDHGAVSQALVLAVHATIAIVGAREEDRADNLELALLRSRTIGVAMGMVMERCAITADESFAVLQRLSSTLNRPLGDIAGELVRTGTLPGLDSACGPDLRSRNGRRPQRSTP